MDLVRFQGKITTGNDGFQVKIHYFDHLKLFLATLTPKKNNPLVEKNIFSRKIVRK